MATNYCICSILPYSAVEDLVDMHPEAFTTLVQTMVRTATEAPMLVLAGRRHCSHPNTLTIPDSNMLVPGVRLMWCEACNVLPCDVIQYT